VTPLKAFFLAIIMLAMITSTIVTAPLKIAAANSTSTSISNLRTSSINQSSHNTSNKTNLGSNSNSNRPTSPGQQPTTQSKISVVASFFPIYEFVKAVGGNKIDTSVLIPIGTEPHDFDPTIQQIQKANSANLLVYNGASMEEPWIHELTPQNEVDASKGINLLTNPGDPEIKGPSDPHVWLDPVLAVKQVQNIRDALDKVDPKNSAYYNQNAQNFIGQLDKLDAEFKGSLSSSNCAKSDFIPFHLAFAYFAKQYGLNVHPIHQGITPNGEILPQKLVEVVSLAQKLGLKVIYSEEFIDPRSAQVIAEQLPGTKVMVLSPIEGINATEQKVGVGYLDKMYQDMAALKIGLQVQDMTH
jgi:zinc transport system substrate-binding protein